MRRGMLLAIAGLGLASTARADILAVYDLDRTIGFYGVANAVIHETFLWPEPGVFEGQGTLFEDIVLHDGDIRVDTLTFGDDDDFEQYVALLTDGLDWYLYDKLGFSDGTLYSAYGLESDRLPIGDDDDDDKDPPDFGGPPDLEGFTIESVTRELSLVLKSPGHDPNGDGIWTDVVISVTTTVYGIPEPATLVLLTVGGAALVRRGHRPRPSS